MSAVLSELTCLAMRRPGADAAPVDVARFYTAMATVHEHLATESRTTTEQAAEHAYAAAARRRAARLLAGVPTVLEESLS